MNETTAARRLTEILEAVAWGKRPCKLCQSDVYFVKARDGKTIVYTADGIDHRQNCSAQVRRPPREPEAQELFPRPSREALDPVR